MRGAVVILACAALSSCAGEATTSAAAAASLEDTYWKLTLLGDAVPTVETNPPEPHIVFASDGGRVHGSGGCNRFSGSYQRSSDTLRIDPGAATRMACPNLQQEGVYFAALAQVRSFEIRGAVLEVRDESKHVVARFVAEPLH